MQNLEIQTELRLHFSFQKLRGDFYFRTTHVYSLQYPIPVMLSQITQKKKHMSGQHTVLFP